MRAQLPDSESPAAVCSDSKSKPCSRQSRVGVTTTARMHTLPCTCAHILLTAKCNWLTPTKQGREIAASDSKVCPNGSPGHNRC